MNTKHYEVIIVGAGPAGLMCAEVLSKSGKSVLVLEKNEKYGDKVCAGGLTRKDLALLDIPDHILEHAITSTAVFSRKNQSSTDAPEAFVFTVNRIEFGTWQMEQLKHTAVDIRNNSKVTAIEKGRVEVNNSDRYTCDFLVGADGYFSIVRKYLQLPITKKLMGIQYLVPSPGINPRLEIYLDASKFHSWYGWIFPHRESFAVGCVCDPAIVKPAVMKRKFAEWLKEKNIDVSHATYSSFPISYDYKGYQFGNIFLTGDAAGLASGMTGEGIYQALVSGKTVAETILQKDHHSDEMDAVIKYNKIQYRILKLFIAAGPFRSLLHGLIVGLLNNKRIKAKINSSFS